MRSHFFHLSTIYLLLYTLNLKSWFISFIVCSLHNLNILRLRLHWQLRLLTSKKIIKIHNFTSYNLLVFKKKNSTYSLMILLKIWITAFTVFKTTLPFLLFQVCEDHLTTGREGSRNGTRGQSSFSQYLGWYLLHCLKWDYFLPHFKISLSPASKHNGWYLLYCLKWDSYLNHIKLIWSGISN